MDNLNKVKASESKEAGVPVQVGYMKNKYDRYDKDKETSKISLPSVVREPKKLDFSWDKVVDEKKKDTSTPVLKEQNILAFLMTASGNESGKSQYLNLVETAGKTASPNSSKPNVEISENITKDMTKNVRSMFEKGETMSYNESKLPSKRISLIENSTETVSVFESVPIATSSDVIKSGETLVDTEQVQKGMTKNLLDQWQKKNEDSTYSSNKKSLIKLVNGDDDDKEEDGVTESEIIQKGLTKSLLNQWTNQTVETSYKPTKKVNQIYDFNVVENGNHSTIDDIDGLEPASKENNNVIVVQKGSAKQLLNQWNEKKNETYVAPKKTVVIVEPEVKKLDEVPDKVKPEKTIITKENESRSLTNKSSSIEDSTITKEKPLNQIDKVITAQENSQPKVEEVPEVKEAEEEIDLDSLQKGLAKAMVLQWKSDHPDESLDDIIQTATKETGTYNELLLDKGIDKTLYDQWKYVKFKNQPRIVRAKKPLVLNIPDKRTRPTVSQVLANQSKEEANILLNTNNMSTDVQVNEKNSLENLHAEKSSNSEHVVENAIENVTENHDAKPSTLSPKFNENNTGLLNEPVNKNLIDKSNTRSSVGLSDQNIVNIDKSQTIFTIDKADGQAVEGESLDQKDDAQKTDTTDIDKVQRGNTKSMLIQLQNKSTDSNHLVQKAPISVETGTEVVSENIPLIRDDVVRASDQIDTDKIEKGFAKHALEQLKQTVESSKTFEKKSIVIPSDELQKSHQPESSEIISQSSENFDLEPVVQQGMTKQLLGQWQNKKFETFQPNKKRIIVEEDEGTISESESVVRTDVVRSSDQSDKDIVEKGMTKNIMNQLIEGNKNKEFSKSYKIVIAETDGVVSENDPINRDDLAREDNHLPTAASVVQQGTTKHLLGQWNKIATEPSEKITKDPVNLVLDSGHISENEPIKRTDVISSDPADKDEIERGFTKSLLNQWQNQNITSTTKPKTRVEIREEDGSVAENIPKTLENVAREGENQDKSIILSGTAKTLVGQWQNKNVEGVKIEKTPIVISHDEGQAAENKPIERSDVIRTDQTNEEVCIERGFTKNILNQWQNIPFQCNTPKERVPISISEKDGAIVENEPIERPDVVKSGTDVNSEELFVQKGFTKSLLNQFQEKKDSSSFQNKKNKIEIREEDGQCVENEPIIRPDVVRASDNNAAGEIYVEKGYTSNILNQFQQNSSKRSSSSRDKTPIVISHEDGKISENIPVQREDVAREGDGDNKAIHVVQRGTAKQLMGQWQNIGNRTFEKEKKSAVFISEDDGRIVESQPVERTDVVKGDSEVDNVSFLSTGMTKSLVGQWKIKQSEEFVPEKKTINIIEDDGHVSENKPLTREDVVNESTNLEDPLIVQKGSTKELLNCWKNLDTAHKSSTKTTVLISPDDGVVAENEPIVRADTVKSDTPVEPTNEMVQKGLAKSLMSQWNTGSINKSSNMQDKKIILELDSGHVAENDPSPKRSDVFREENQEENILDHMPLKGQATLVKQKLMLAGQYKLQSGRKEPINIFNTNPGEKSVVENEPIKRQGVAKEDDENDADHAVILKKGYAKNMVGFWAKPKSDGDQNNKKQLILELAEGPAVYENDPAPSLKHEIKNVTDAGVFENEPITRQDVAREADFQPEIISANMTRNVRKLWSQKEAECSNPTINTRKPEPVRFTPPREKSPPPVIKEEFKSTHTLTFKHS